MLCACLGTVSFTASAGKVVALRLRLPFVDALNELPKGERPKDSFDLPEGVSLFTLAVAEVKDSRINSELVVDPKFKPAGTRPNWFGSEIDRVNAIDSVFAYDRGQQIDLRTQESGALVQAELMLDADSEEDVAEDMLEQLILPDSTNENLSAEAESDSGDPIY